MTGPFGVALLLANSFRPGLAPVRPAVYFHLTSLNGESS